MPTYSVKFRDGHSFAVGAKDKPTARRIALQEHKEIHEAESKGMVSATSEPESLHEIGR